MEHSSLETAFRLETSDIWSSILALSTDGRRALFAVLKWTPELSHRLRRSLDVVGPDWVRQHLEEEYLLILRDLNLSIQETRIFWDDVAQINSRLDIFQERLRQMVPHSGAPQIPAPERAVGESSFFHGARQITIHGGSFTIYCSKPDEGVSTALSQQSSLRAPPRNNIDHEGVGIGPSEMHVSGMSNVFHDIMRSIRECF
ncbi:hypothetical protein D9613_012391 [Agrocybe pediades]|uniref:Uncharacterized protein n=1 Tax=Agrocybe pediades TaxID=84607 RepID=A0A8H4QR02_9AGAR|nr:hypothetical protein D9613_012391 [Agrocybe pediades]